MLGLASSVLDEVTARRMQEVGFVELPFKQYFHTPNTHTGTTRFSVSTQSLDRIWIAYRNPDFATQRGLVTLVGNLRAGAFTSTAAIPDTTAAGRSHRTSGSPRSSSEAPTASGTRPNTSSSRSAARWPRRAELSAADQSSSIPQFKANAIEMYEISKSSTDDRVDGEMTQAVHG